jgi:hypothetical protein
MAEVIVCCGWALPVLLLHVGCSCQWLQQLTRQWTVLATHAILLLCYFSGPWWQVDTGKVVTYVPAQLAACQLVVGR